MSETTTQETPKVEVPAEATKPVETLIAEKPATEIPAVSVEEPKKEKAAVEIPEKIELKLPEKSALNADALEKITSFAKDNGLTQKQAEAILQREDKIEAERPAALIEQQQKLSESWRQLSLADKEVGGENLSQNVSYAQKALDTYGSPVFKKMMTETGLGNHPEVLRFMARAGKAISNDRVVHGEMTPPKTQQTIAKKFYPDMKSAQS